MLYQSLRLKEHKKKKLRYDRNTARKCLKYTFVLEPFRSYPKAEYEELLGLPCPISWLAVKDNKIVGLYFGKIELTKKDQVCKSRRVAFIQDLVTLPKYRGQGIATALMMHTRQQAVEEKADSLELCVWSFNDSALRFYERMGMRVQYYRMEEKLEIPSS